MAFAGGAGAAERGSATIAAETPAGECFLTLPSVDAHPWKRLEIVQGYRSDYYGQRQAVPLVEAEVSGELPLRMFTLVAAEVPAMWRREAADSQGEIYELRRGEASGKLSWRRGRASRSE